MQPIDRTEIQFTMLNVISLVLSLFLLFSILLESFIITDKEVIKILNFADNLICAFFLFEFCSRFYKAKSKLEYMKFGWIDLIASIPFLDSFRGARIFRLILIIRVLRTFRSFHHLMRYLGRNKATNAFASSLLLAVLMILFSAIAVLLVEDDPNSNIKTAGDALWWAYTTITTVGYGDKFPVTLEGRLIAATLMTIGVGLFGVFTGFIASKFLGDRKE